MFTRRPDASHPLGRHCGQPVGPDAGEKGGCRGFDAGKKITGRKRHLVVDTLGLVWSVAVHAANVHDTAGARPLLEVLDRGRLPRLEAIFADQAYPGTFVDWAADAHGIRVEIVKKLEGQSTFVVLPKRWVVERTFAWIMRYRRLRSDYETTVPSSVAWIHTALIHRMVRYVARC